MKIKPEGTTIAKYLPNFANALEYLLLKPTDCMDE